jgi:hypothetical protein
MVKVITNITIGFLFTMLPLVTKVSYPTMIIFTTVVTNVTVFVGCHGYVKAPEVFHFTNISYLV